MKDILKAVGTIVMFVVAYFIVLLPFNQVWFNTLPMYDIFKNSDNLVGNIVLEIILISVFYILVLKVKRKKPLQYWNFNPISIKTAVVAALIGIASGLYTVSFFKLPYIMAHFPALDDLLKQFFETGALIAFLGFWITSSVFKEILFRGVIFNEIEKVSPFVVAVILQSVIYGAGSFYYFGIEAIIFASFGAIIFALIYSWAKSIVASTIAQFACIATLSITALLKDRFVNDKSAAVILAVSILATLSLTFYFWIINRKTVREADNASLSV